MYVRKQTSTMDTCQRRFTKWRIKIFRSSILHRGLQICCSCQGSCFQIDRPIVLTTFRRPLVASMCGIRHRCVSKLHQCWLVLRLSDLTAWCFDAIVPWNFCQALHAPGISLEVVLQHYRRTATDRWRVYRAVLRDAMCLFRRLGSWNSACKISVLSGWQSSPGETHCLPQWVRQRPSLRISMC